MYVVTWCAVRADNAMPDARVGNCWSWVLAKVVRDGGYIVLRPVPRVRMFVVGRVPHGFWLQRIPDGAVIQQTEPLTRYRGKWKFWKLFYFPFNLRSIERKRDIPGPWNHKS